VLISDQESYLNYLRIITRIIGYQNNIQRDYASVAFYHVNGEQIEIGGLPTACLFLKRFKARIVMLEFQVSSPYTKKKKSLD
jgi:hypothetical protein